MDFILNADTSVLMFIREHFTCAFLDFLMPIITLLGEYGAFPIAVCITLLCLKKTRLAGFEMAVAIIMGFVIVNLTLKPLVARVRPYDAIEGIKLLIEAQSDYSFPSGHTLIAFECAGVISRNYTSFAPYVFVMASLVAFSRLYLFVHYPTDVLASVILGLLFAFASGKIVEKITEKIYIQKVK